MQVTSYPEEFRGLLPVIATPEYFRAINVTDFGYFIEEGLILPYLINKKAIFRFMSFTTGVLGTSNTNSEDKFLENVIKFIRKNMKVDFIKAPYTTALFNTFPKDSSACRFGSYIIDLKLTEDQLFANLHSKHRNVIKKAEKDGIIITNDSGNFDESVKLIQDTLKRQNLNCPSKEYFKKLKENLGEKAEFWIAKDSEQIHGTSMILWSKDQSAYYISGGSSTKPHTGAMNLLHWEAIKMMKKRGVLEYNFVGARINPAEGSKFEGIQRFKERFGGPLKEGYIWKIILNRPKYTLFRFIMKLMAKIRNVEFVEDIIDQERARLNQ